MIIERARILAIALLAVPVIFGPGLLSPASAQNIQKIGLSPQDVVDHALNKGIRSQNADLTAQRSYLTLQRALGVFDLQFKFTPAYEYSQVQTIANSGNPIERNLTLVSTLSKQFSTGTNLALDFANTQQVASLTTSAAQLRSPVGNLYTSQLTARQALLRNAFGYGDRLGIEMGEASVQAARQTRDESLEQVLLDVMIQYWNTYTASEQLKQNIAARGKYEELVRYVRRKAGYNLSAPGELPRLQAELQGVEQKVKSSSAAYLNSLDSLLTSIQLRTTAEVELNVPRELPPVPQLAGKDIEELRPVRVAKINQQNAQRELEQTKAENRPKLDFVARARSTGADREDSRALANMSSGSYPYFYVGFEFEAPLGSELKRGLLAEAEISNRISENDLRLARDSARDTLQAQERQVASQYAVAKLAVESVELRAKVVRDLETAFRQGRQPLIELIRAFNELFNAQLESARAVGQYHIALNQLAAARDELVKSAQAR